MYNQVFYIQDVLPKGVLKVSVCATEPNIDMIQDENAEHHVSINRRLPHEKHVK